MASFSLPEKYQAHLGAGVFSELKAFTKRQVSSVADALPTAVANTLLNTKAKSGGAPVNTSLPDVSEVDRPKTNPMVYLGVGVGILAALAMVMGKRKQAAA